MKYFVRFSYVIIPMLLILFAIPSFGQVIIRHGDIPVEPGTVRAFYTESDSQGIEIDLGLDGADREWDFSDYVFENVLYDSLINPENAPEAETYPNANRVLHSAGGFFGLDFSESFQYEVVADTGWHMLGLSAIVAMQDFEIELPLEFREPVMLMPMPAQMNAEWEIGFDYRYAMEAPDTLLEGMLDSIIVTIEIGGFSNLDAWGVLHFPDGDANVLRQHVLLGGEVSVMGVRYLMGRRIELELPYGYELEAAHTYRWIAPEIGELLSVTSFPGEEEENFNLAANIRVRFFPPSLDFTENHFDFGEINLEQTAQVEVIISNDGDGNGWITNMFMIDGYENIISLAEELPFRIPAQSSDTLHIIWTPSEAGNMETTIGLRHNDINLMNPIDIELRGFCRDLGVDIDNPIPRGFHLNGCYPNPFNSQTRVSFDLPSKSLVRFEVFDIAGNQIGISNSEWMNAGSQNILFDATNLPAGIYIYQVHAGDKVLTGKAVLSK